MKPAIPLLLVSAIVCSAADPARDARWYADLDYLAQQLSQRHPNFFSAMDRERFDSTVAEARRAIPQSTDAEITIRLAAVVALGRDSHTNLLLQQRQNEFRVLPLALRWFDDGLFIVGAAEGYESVIGGRVTGIGDCTVAEAFDRVKTLISHENEHHAREVSQVYLTYADILQATGITTGVSEVRFVVDHASGKRETIAIVPAERGSPMALRRMPNTTEGFLPLYQRNVSREYWFTYIASSRTLYFAYNVCRNNPSQPFARFNDELWSFFDTHDVDRVIIDLRNNGGGNSSVLLPFLESGLRRAASFDRIRPYVLIGRQTHSSAMTNAVQLSEGPVRLVGQPTGGSPNSYGEVQTFTLPNSQLLVRYSTRYFSISSRYPGQTVPPDVYVPFYSSDYFSRHDPVLAAALAHTDPATVVHEAGAAISVVNAATFRPGGSVAPGSLAALFGNFDAGDEVSVTIGGQEARVLAATATQINVQVPSAVNAGVALVRVLRSGIEIAAGPVHVVPAAPGLFTHAVRDEGGVVHVFATGLGEQVVRAFAGAEQVDIKALAATDIPGVQEILVQVPRGSEMPLFVIAGTHASNAVLIR